MSLRFIVGRAGSGKTHLCYSEICERLSDGRDNQLILLVPEQATFQNEMELAARTSSGGLLRAQVISFRRLAWRVLNEVGGAARVHIDDLGRRMILRSIIERRKKELKVFGRAADQIGFTDVVAGFLSELKSYGIMPGDLTGVSERLEDQWQIRLCDKIRDIDMIYEEMENHLRGRCIDPDDYLNLLAERIELSPTVCGAEVWMDGFTGFTPREYAVIEKIMLVARRVSVALCAEAKALDKMPGEGHVFYSTAETALKLKRLARDNSVPVEPAVVLKESHRFIPGSSLSYLEKHFFENSVSPYRGRGEVKLVAAAGPRAEVEAAAREIIGLCRDGGYRWRDIAVLVRDIGRYHVLINTVFKDYDIPFFIDHKGSVTHHPLVELIRSSLEVAAGGWGYDPVFRYLKTDLAPVGREEADILENYVLAHGIRGAAWTDGKDWHFKRSSLNGEDRWPGEEQLLEKVNTARRKGLSPLLNFYNRVSGDRCNNARTISEALFDMLVELDVPSRLTEWSARAKAEGDLVLAGEHDRIWGQVVDLLDQVVAAFGEDPLPMDKYAKILESGLTSLRLGLIPPGLDQVTVGSLDRSRSPAVRAALVLGVNDGVFPARPKEEGLLTDMDRTALADKGISLAPGVRRKVFDEQFLVYIALTRASSRLWVSYSMADGEGRSMLPSWVVHRIRQILPDAGEYMVGVEPSGSGDDNLDYVAGSGRTLGYLSSRLREYLTGKESHPLWWDVYNWYLDNLPSGEGIGIIRKGLFQKNIEKRISAGLARSFYGGRLRAGISRIERFNSCPFAHFLTYGLKIRERAHYRLTPPDMGQFFHLALKMFAETVMQSGLDWGDLDSRTVNRMAGAIVDEIAPRLQNEILLSTARYRYMVTRFKRRLARAAVTMADHLRRGRFRPVGLEVKFGPGGVLPPVIINLSGGNELEISGRIDRVDFCRWEKGTHILVVDYKSGYKDMDLAEILYGVNIQLPAYLDVAVAHSELLTGDVGQPGGILYFSVTDPLVITQGPVSEEEAEKLLLKKLKMKGIVLADPDVVRLIDSIMDRHSEIIPVSMTAGGDFYKNSPVATAEQFGILKKHLWRIYREAGEKILSGEVGIEPIKIKGRLPCRFCKYKAVCRFDPALPENRPRIPPRIDDELIWERMSLIPEVDAHE
ncbi:MAG: helicase-exonuclease AddAB subunit AddB [Bacillota bacterium]